MRINDNCDTFYGGILLTPYFYLILSTILFTCLQFVCLRILFPAVWPVLSSLFVGNKKETAPKESTNECEITNPVFVTTNDSVDVEKFSPSTSSEQTKDPNNGNHETETDPDWLKPINSMDDAQKFIENDLKNLQYSSLFWYFQMGFFLFSIFSYFLVPSSVYDSTWNSWDAYANFYGFLLNGPGIAPFLTFLGAQSKKMEFILFMGKEDLWPIQMNQQRRIHQHWNTFITTNMNDFHEKDYILCTILKCKDINGNDNIPDNNHPYLVDILIDDEIHENINTSLLFPNLENYKLYVIWYICEYKIRQIEQEEASRMFFYFLLILPPVLTHVIPGIIVYCWVLLTVLIGLLLFTFIIIAIPPLSYKWIYSIHGDPGVDDPFLKGYLRFSFQICFSFLGKIFFLYCLQTTFNYMGMFYNGENYLEVISKEYSLRSQSECFLEDKFTNFANALTFFSWV